MTSIHQKLKTAIIFSDGEGGFVLKVATLGDGTIYDKPLSVSDLLTLASTATDAARQLLAAKR